MIITHKLKPMDLSQKQNTGRVDVVQGDKYSRNIEFTFMYNESAWQIPDRTTAIVRYKKPDATGGNYDTLPDGSTAYQINGNVLTVCLAPQVCTVPGIVQLSVGLIQGSAEINTFSINIVVQPNPGAIYQSEDYIRLSGAVPNSGWSPNMYLGTDESGNVIVKEGTSGGGASGNDGATIPEYVRTEAETVARIVNQHQSNDSIVFPFLSDAHCGYYTDMGNAATTLAGQLLNQIGKRTPYDFIVHGGDYSTGAWNTTKLDSFEHIEDYTELTSEANKGVPSLWCAGNHDDAAYQATANRVSQKELFGLVGRKNRMSSAVCPNGCNYGYMDLENRKLRVIYLDTDDKRNWGTVLISSSASVPEYLNAQNVGGDQLRWLANTGLDFTDKANPAEWNIVVVSHAALNISGTNTDAVSGTVHAHNTENAAKVINAYRTGKSGSITHNGVTVNYNFTTVESKATVICAVHGHNHKFGSETLTGGVLSIGCPNVMNGRERASDDGNTYTKTAGTANGTSFCILTIDRENCVIYADCVGAGYDREFTYTTEVIAYTNQIPMSTDTDGSVYGYKAGYRLSSSGAADILSGSYLTGFIPIAVGDTVYMKNVTYKYGVTSGLTSANQRVSFYNASKAHVVQINAMALAGNANGVKGDDNIWTQFTPKSTMGGVDCSGVAYFRINAAYIGDDSIITVNEPIG